MLAKFFIPAQGPEDWKRGLVDEKKQWKTGHSAKTLAYCWHDAMGFPAPIEAMITKSLGPTTMIMGIPEYSVSIPGGRRPSQNDLFVLARNGNGLAAIMVEGKVAETFDRTVSEWLAKATDGKRKRLRYLCSLLGVTEYQVQNVRYQLLHRTASSLIEAERFGATAAVMLVHSFSPEHAWFDDFAVFARLFGIKAEINGLALAGSFNGIDLYLGWAHGDAKYLNC